MKIVGIVDVNDNYPFIGDDGEEYAEDGSYLIGGSGRYDLIREHTTEPASLSISIDTTDMRAEMERVMRACQAFIDEYDR